MTPYYTLKASCFLFVVDCWYVGFIDHRFVTMPFYPTIILTRVYEWIYAGNQSLIYTNPNEYVLVFNYAYIP